MASRKKSLSCPPTFHSFQMLSDPLTVEQLQMISNNDKAEMEDIKNYESNGFMPIKLYQEIGPNNRFKIIRKLGFGTYSTVWMCKDELRQTERYYALKILKAAEFAKASAFREIKILERIRADDSDHTGHNRIVSFYGHFSTSSVNGKHYCLVSQMMGKSLLNLVADYKRLEPQGVQLIVKQVLQGLSYLHTKCNFIHADLKLENILICEDNSYFSNMASRVKQFDEHGVMMPRSYITTLEWEECKNSHCEKEKQGNLLRNTLIYKPPEHTADSLLFVNPNIQIKISDLGCGILENAQHPILIQPWGTRALEVYLEAPYSFPIDIWSVGCISYRLATGKFLFNENRPPNISKEAWQVYQMWNLIGGISKDIALNGSKSSEFFDSEGNLMVAPKQPVESCKISDQLVEKCKWKSDTALTFEDFVMSLVEPDPALRATASTALNAEWLRE